MQQVAQREILFMAPKSRWLAERIAKEIRERHLKQTRPGGRLLPVRELARQLGVCVRTVLAAQRILAERGELEIRHGSGAYLPEQSGPRWAGVFTAFNILQPHASIFQARVAWELSRQLEEYKRQRGIQTAEFGSRDMVYLLALRSLNRYVPVLFHFTETQQVHPWAVYAALRQLVGELSTFSERINVLGELEDGKRALPAYDHRNLWECFFAAQSLISQLLDEITAGPEYIFRLTYDGTYFTADLDPAVFESRNRFYLVLKTEADPKAVLQSLSTVVKMSSREHLPILIARALPGIRIEPLPVPPQELPRRARSLYFSIDIHGDLWSFVEKGRNLAIYWDSAPEDLEAELMVVGRS